MKIVLIIFMTFLFSNKVHTHVGPNHSEEIESELSERKDKRIERRNRRKARKIERREKREANRADRRAKRKSNRVERRGKRKANRIERRKDRISKERDEVSLSEE